MLGNYQAIRYQVHIIGEKASHGCCYADSWSSVQFQRMANVSLLPGKEKLSPSDMLKDIDNGIFIVGNGSFSIDQQRSNAQSGGQMFYAIQVHTTTRRLDDVDVQMPTQETLKSCKP